MNCIQNKAANQNFRKKALRLAAAPLALALCLGMTAPAFAQEPAPALPSSVGIANTVTVTATKPDGQPLDTDNTASEQVDVIDAEGSLSITVETLIFEPDGTTARVGPALAGDVVKYIYTVTNTGTVSLTNVRLTDNHDGSVDPVMGSPILEGTSVDSSDLVTTDAIYEKLAPAGAIKFTSTYTVTPADILAAGGGVATPDNDIDGSTDAEGGYLNAENTAATATGNVTTQVALAITPHLLVSKTSDIPDGAKVKAGDVITYTYTVKNDGNVPISNINLADTDNSASPDITPTFVEFTINVDSNSTNTGNTINVLQPGDEATYTATYTVTQADIDTLQ